MNETTDIKEKENIQYLCPWMMVGSKICPMGLCRFWSHDRKDCRWNLWLEQQLLKTDLTLSQLALKLDEKFSQKEIKAWKKNLKKKI